MHLRCRSMYHGRISRWERARQSEAGPQRRKSKLQITSAVRPSPSRSTGVAEVPSLCKDHQAECERRRKNLQRRATGLAQGPDFGCARQAVGARGVSLEGPATVCWRGSVRCPLAQGDEGIPGSVCRHRRAQPVLVFNKRTISQYSGADVLFLPFTRKSFNYGGYTRF